MSSPKIVRCPNCAGQSVWAPENTYRPFCSERCKLVDLGQWATNGYRVPLEQATPEEKNSED